MSDEGLADEVARRLGQLLDPAELPAGVLQETIAISTTGDGFLTVDLNYKVGEIVYRFHYVFDDWLDGSTNEDPEEIAVGFAALIRAELIEQVDVGPIPPVSTEVRE